MARHAFQGFAQKAQNLNLPSLYSLTLSFLRLMYKSRTHLQEFCIRSTTAFKISYNVLSMMFSRIPLISLKIILGQISVVQPIPQTL